MLTAVSGLTVMAQREILLVWGEKGAPNQKTIPADPVLRDNQPGDDVYISTVTRPQLEVFVPDKSLDKGKAMIVCPGGGYGILAYQKEGTEIAEWLQGLGYHVFVLQYRIPNTKPIAIQDAQRAIRLVKNLGETYGYNQWLVGIMGFSAGGHLSARAATSFEEDSYPPRDEIDEISARPDFVGLIYPAYLDDAPDRQLSEDISIPDNTPPIFIMGTVDDPYCNDAIVMAQSLRDKKQDVEFHLYPKGGHGYGLRKGNPSAEAWPGLMACWLTQFDQ